MVHNVLGKEAYIIENLTLTGFPCEENSTGPEKVNVGIEI
jgi:hypothetical protein